MAANRGHVVHLFGFRVNKRVLVNTFILKLYIIDPENCSQTSIHIITIQAKSHYFRDT